MEQQAQTPEFQIAEAFYSQMSRLIEEHKEWYSEAQNWNNGNYGRALADSMNVALDLLEFKIEKGEGIKSFLESIHIFLRELNNYKPTSEIESKYVETHRAILSLAGTTLDQINKLIDLQYLHIKDTAAQSKTTKKKKVSNPEVSNKSYRPEIYELEEKLNKLGFYKSAIDGFPGGMTESVIRYFQAQHNLKETGIADEETMKAINDAIEELEFPEKEQKEGKKLFLPYLAPEGNHQATDDKLDFEYDIQSLATVISLEEVKPPLAIGLFGNWGSGKSFFMEKLSQKIQKYAEEKTEGFVKNVVQVKFNSWHYSDSNLWASLTTQIFESLHDYATKKQFGPEAIKTIYKELNITSHQLEETQKKLIANTHQENVLQEQKTNVEETIVQKKAALSLWTAKDLLKIVFSDPYIQQDFENIKTQFEGEKLIDNINQIDEKITEIDTISGKIVESMVLLKKNHKGKWIWVWILLVLFAIGAWLVLGPLKEKIQEFISGGYIVTTLFLAWLTNFWVKIGPYFNKINLFYKRLKSLKRTIDTEKDKVKLKEHNEVARLNKEISDLTASKAALEMEQTFIAEKKKKLENEIIEIGSGKLLANFLEGKSVDDAYINQLGIISWVRKDFAKLNELFQSQKFVRSSERDLPAEVQIDRIVLYIDDLDRCNEDVVIKVLEAIHLILAFPLFVVVVGVDPRWLNNALTEKYKRLFGSQNANVKASYDKETRTFHTGAATSYDYLEKIFQIPFSLRPINQTGRKNLIGYLLRNEMEEKSTEQTSPSVQKVTNVAGPAIVAGTTPTGKPIIGPAITTPNIQTSDEPKVKLTFMDEELAYMQKISSLFGHSPRTINRFINIYRIIKSHRNLKISENFSEDDFIPIMIVLSVVVGFSAYAQGFIDKLIKADGKTTFAEFLAESDLPAGLNTAITENIDNETGQLPLKPFKDNIELISRFSFRTFEV